MSLISALAVYLDPVLGLAGIAASIILFRFASLSSQGVRTIASPHSFPRSVEVLLVGNTIMVFAFIAYAHTAVLTVPALELLVQLLAATYMGILGAVILKWEMMSG